MKFTKFLAVALAVVSLNAFALMNATEVGALLDSGQAVAAEKAIKEVLATRDTPKLHYMLAQAYQKQGRNGEAATELNKASAMDPSHSFASSEAKFREISASVLGVKVAYSEKPKEAVASSGPSVGTVLLYMITLVGGALLIGMGIVAFKRKREREAEENRLNEKLETAQHEVASLMQEVESKILQEKTSAVVNEKRLAALQTLKSDVLRLYEDAKATGTDEYAIDRIGNRRRDLSSTLRNVMLKSYTEPTVSDEPTPKVKVSRPTPMSKRVSTPKQRELETVSVPAPTHTTTTQAPSTVVVQQDNSLNNALTTAILINELNHSHHHHDHSSRNYDSGRSSSWDSTPTHSDSGRSSSWDTDTSSTSRSDSGSSSSWGSSSNDDDDRRSSSSSSWSSSDSGSSSSWSDSSSSSSSDSGSSSDW